MFEDLGKLRNLDEAALAAAFLQDIEAYGELEVGRFNNDESFAEIGIA